MVFNIPFEIFATYLAMSTLIGLIGVVMAIKKMDGAPFITMFAGIMMFALIVLIDDITFSSGQSNSGITEVWNQQEITGQASIHNGTNNIVIKTEHLTSSSSLLNMKTVNCITVAIGKTGSPPITTPVILGVFSTTVTNSIAETKYEFGRINVTEINIDKTFFKRCNLVNDYQLITNDRIGLMYRAGDASNLITWNENTQNPFDGTITVVSNFNDATNTWNAVSGSDVGQITLTLEKTPTSGTTFDFNNYDVWAFMIVITAFWIILGVIFQLRK